MSAAEPKQAIAITIPNDQREGNQASVHRWLKNVGDTVKKNEPILEINTDKVTLEVVAPISGTLVEILKTPKQSCELSETFGRIAPFDSSADIASSGGSSGSESKSQPLTSPVADGSSKRHSPAVRALSAGKGVDLAAISGSGLDGRITARDVERVSASAPSAARGQNTSSADILLPHTPMRRAIAAEMSKSVTIAPHVTSVFECDFDAIIEHREKHKQEFANKGVKLTLTPYIVLATVAALRAVPEVNASWHDDHVAIHPEINIGIATAIESAQGGGAGLAVPVLRRADSLSLFDLAKRLGDYSEAGRNGKLTSADLHGGTFTISNHGVSGSLFASPIIILQPQVAILGVGKIERRVVLEKINGREMMSTRSRAYVTLTIDHRALDGFTANKFLTNFCNALQAAV